MAVPLTSRLPYHRAALVIAKTNGPISCLRASACRERDARHKNLGTVTTGMSARCDAQQMIGSELSCLSRRRIQRDCAGGKQVSVTGTGTCLDSIPTYPPRRVPGAISPSLTALRCPVASSRASPSSATRHHHRAVLECCARSAPLQCRAAASPTSLAEWVSGSHREPP